LSLFLGCRGLYGMLPFSIYDLMWWWCILLLNCCVCVCTCLTLCAAESSHVLMYGQSGHYVKNAADRHRWCVFCAQCWQSCSRQQLTQLQQYHDRGWCCWTWLCYQWHPSCFGLWAFWLQGKYSASNKYMCHSVIMLVSDSMLCWNATLKLLLQYWTYHVLFLSLSVWLWFSGMIAECYCRWAAGDWFVSHF